MLAITNRNRMIPLSRKVLGFGVILFVELTPRPLCGGAKNPLQVGFIGVSFPTIMSEPSALNRLRNAIDQSVLHLPSTLLSSTLEISACLFVDERRAVVTRPSLTGNLYV